MKHNFTVEEVNLICIFVGKSRTGVIENINRALKYLEDSVLLELSEKVLGRLKDMSDEEFAELDFIEAE